MDKNKEQYYLKNVLDQTEQKDVNNLLSGDLKDIFNHVQNECKDFKENVFLKLVDHLDNTMGHMDKSGNDKQQNKKRLEPFELPKDHVSDAEGLVNKFEQKAKNL